MSISDRPRFADVQHAGRLQAEARDAVARRSETFPRLVREGKLTEADADREFCTWLAIRADWCPDEDQRYRASQADKLEMLERSLQRCRRAVAADPTDEARERLSRIEAMLWVQRQGGPRRSTGEGEAP